jgi:glycosyltransferase involved in cell wall biosynthesis
MSVSICIPTYNRKVFEKLIEHNINTQTYFNIKEIIIVDDGDDEPLCIRTNYPIHYYRVNRCSIGDKRNLMCNLSKCDYIAFMDTDDFYDSDYISYSIFEMETNDKSIAGSADMNVIDSSGNFYKQRCMFLHMLNEATLVFRKSAWSPFNGTNSNEAVPFLQNKLNHIIETNIDRVMCCVSHDKNTIPKTQWMKEQFKCNPLSQYTTHQKILSQLNV